MSVLSKNVFSQLP